MPVYGPGVDVCETKSSRRMHSVGKVSFLICVSTLVRRREVSTLFLPETSGQLGERNEGLVTTIVGFLPVH